MAPAPFSAKLLALAEQIARVALAADTGGLGPFDRTILTDQHCGAIGDALIVEHKAVGRCHAPFGMEVGQEGVGDAVKRLRPRLVAKLAVNADTQDLGITVLESLFKRFESRDFNASCGREIQRIKHEQDVLGTLEARELDRGVQVTVQLEIGGLGSGIDHGSGRLEVVGFGPVPHGTAAQSSPKGWQPKGGVPGN